MICKSSNYNSFDSYDLGFETNLLEYDSKCLVITIDIDANKVILAKHNAALYGVADKIKFVIGDFFVLGKIMKADVLVTSPLWGGPDYFRKRTFSLADLCRDNGGGKSIMRIAKSIAPRVILHLPKNSDKCKVHAHIRVHSTLSLY